jgi:N-acetylglucosamine-6-phosphate deacetylase
MRTAGLFDLQVNGFAGVDFNDAALTPDALDHALEAMLATGVTQCLPTLITASRDMLRARFAALDAAVAKSRLGPLMVPGYHLEGPFLNPAPGFRGCHPAHDMIAPDITLVDQLRKALRLPIALVTIAPELDGSAAFIAAARSQGSAVAIGHSDARTASVSNASAAGASLSTHLGNGVAHQGHKFDNPIYAQLADDALMACFIADGIHVPMPALKVMLRAKGIGRSILVTDAVAGAAAPPGLYPFAGMTVERGADGAVREPGAPHLAGSALTLDQAVRNIVNWELASFDDAVAMASNHPRKALARQTNAPVNSASIAHVVWSAEYAVQEVTLADKIMFRREK